MTRAADCHPDRPHYAHGNCQQCYLRIRARDPAVRARNNANRKLWSKTPEHRQRINQANKARYWSDQQYRIRRIEAAKKSSHLRHTSEYKMAAFDRLKQALWGE